MQALNLDFASRKRVHMAGAVALALCVLSCGVLAYLLMEMNDKITEARTQQQRMQAQGSKQTGKGEQRRLRDAVEAEMRGASVVMERLAMPWDRLLNALEASVDEQSTLLTIEPNPVKGQVTLTVEAKDLPSMVAYQRRLETNALFREVQILNHQMQIQNPMKPVRFEVLARWKQEPAQ